MNQTILISGMTCQNCVRHVTQALREIDGVRDVSVTLEPAQATIQADRIIERGEIAGALDEAGYALA